MAYDLPAGGKRLTPTRQRLLRHGGGGDSHLPDGEPTGALPGRLVRGGRDTARRRTVTRGDAMSR